MPKVDFSHVEDVQDYTPIPAGKYLCKIVDVEEARTQYDDEMWKLRLQVIEGEYAGRSLFDNLVFSAAALKRVKLVCSRLGLDVSGELNLTPDMIKNRTCLVTTQVEEYVDAEDKKKMRNSVGFAGYEKAGAAEPAEASETQEEAAF